MSEDQTMATYKRTKDDSVYICPHCGKQFSMGPHRWYLSHLNDPRRFVTQCNNCSNWFTMLSDSKVHPNITREVAIQDKLKVLERINHELITRKYNKRKGQKSHGRI